MLLGQFGQFGTGLTGFAGTAGLAAHVQLSVPLLLAAGLGACTTMTLRMYANLKKIPLTHVTCDVTHNKAHLDESQTLGAGKAKVDVFTRYIRLEGDMTEEQRQALLRIADKCPVHKLMTQVTTEVVTELAPA